MSRIKEDYSKHWNAHHGTYISGQAAIDGVDAIAIAMEQRWGVGRLRLLVPVELRERFDRQRYLLNAAIWHGDLAEVQNQAARMTKAWYALDGAAVALHASFLSPEVWEATLADGTVVALVQTPEEAHAVVGEGRKVVVYTVAEIARMLDNYREVTAVKAVIPGAEVTVIRREISDPLNAIRDGVSLNDTLDDLLPEFGA